MKNVFSLSVLLLLLAACGGDEPAPDADTQQPAAELDEAATEVGETVAGDESDDAAPEILEESAAEPEDGEQAILLARADAAEAASTRDWQFRENQHYIRLVPTQPTVGGADKIEVAEIFWYGCPHCFSFESLINPWAENLPPNVRFVRIPAMWNRGLALHAQLFYTEQVLARNGAIDNPEAFRNAVFVEFHRRGNRLATEESIKNLFTRLGVSAEDFDKTWNSFEVSQKMRIADDLTRRYGISNVPTMVVNGKYRTGGAEAGSYDKLLEVLDELIARESIR